MDEPGRTIATIGLLLVFAGLLGLRRRKPLQVMGHTLISFRTVVWALGVGATLVAVGLMFAYPESR